MSIENYGFYPGIPYDEAKGIPARITAVHRERFEVVCDQGQGFARLKTSAYQGDEQLYPTTGDFVLLDWQTQGDSRILATLPRKTYFSRLDPSSSGHGEQAVAANFDYVFILQGLDHNFNPRRLERYLTLAWQSGGVPVVVLTKADCCEDIATPLRAAGRLATGVGVYAISARTGAGLEQLADYLKPGKTVVLLGSSGVGKSSLVNALAGSQRMATGDVREEDSRGRHTTTHRQLLRLESGVLVIDTPGMRELGMWDVSEGLGQSFADVEQYLGQCRFSDCTHGSEPGCGVRAAIQRGELSQQRWESYQHLGSEARYADDKEGYLRQKRETQKGISKLVKQLKQSPQHSAPLPMPSPMPSQKPARKQDRQQPDYRRQACSESFVCAVCGAAVAPEAAGSQHRNHCPRCLSSLHLDNEPGDRASLCKGVMEPIGVWVRKNGEWAIIHRCRACGALGSNRIAADDNSTLLLSIAMKPLAMPPFPLWPLEGIKPEE